MDVVCVCLSSYMALEIDSVVNTRIAKACNWLKEWTTMDVKGMFNSWSQNVDNVLRNSNDSSGVRDNVGIATSVSAFKGIFSNSIICFPGGRSIRNISNGHWSRRRFGFFSVERLNVGVVAWASCIVPNTIALFLNLNFNLPAFVPVGVDNPFKLHQTLLKFVSGKFNNLNFPFSPFNIVFLFSDKIFKFVQPLDDSLVLLGNLADSWSDISHLSSNNHCFSGISCYSCLQFINFSLFPGNWSLNIAKVIVQGFDFLFDPGNLIFKGIFFLSQPRCIVVASFNFFIKMFNLIFKIFNLQFMFFDAPSDIVSLLLQNGNADFKAGNLILVILDSGFQEGQFVSQFSKFPFEFIDGLEVSFSLIELILFGFKGGKFSLKSCNITL